MVQNPLNSSMYVFSVWEFNNFQLDRSRAQNLSMSLAIEINKSPADCRIK